MQRHNGVATVGIVVSVGVSTRGGVLGPMPCEALASGFRQDIVGAVVDGQFQRIDAGATGSVRIVVGVGSRCGIRLTVPREALASGLRHDVVRAVVDGY